MTSEQIILFSLFAAVFALLLWGRFRYDLVAFGALLTGVVLGVVPVKHAFDGFGHPATIIVALVLVVSAGLVRSGAVRLITRTLIDASRSLSAHIAIMGTVGGALSAVMSNFASLALLLPAELQMARKSGRSPGATLMPINFATVLGGMITLIGTPPNILISGIRQDMMGTPFSMFDFAPVGLAVAFVGIGFLALVGWRLLPQREAETPEPVELQPYVAELTVPEGNAHIGQRVEALYGAAEEHDVAILGLIRGGRRRYGPAAHVTIAAQDALVLEATPEALEAFRSAQGFSFADERREELIRAEGHGVDLIEVVVPKNSRLDGRTAQAVGLDWRQHTVLMGISRQGQRITRQMRRTMIRPGDILLLLIPQESATAVIKWLGVLPLADRGVAVTDDSKKWLAMGLFAAGLLAAGTGLVYLPVALGIIMIAFLATRILPLQGLYTLIDWPVVVLLASMIPLGNALVASGGSQLIAGAMLGATLALPVWAVLALLMAVTMTLTDVLNNNATVIVVAPIAIQLAHALGVNPDAFLMAVAISASCAFLTPIGDEANTLILGPGGYRFGDYWRMGLPLEILVVATSVPLILIFWPL